MNYPIVLCAFSTLISSCMTSKVIKEHKEARAVSISEVDFSCIRDGNYTGYYPGGIYGWREVSVEVVVESGTVITITSKKRELPENEITISNEIFNRVIEHQSLNIDVISGATLTSKAYLKGIETALIKTGGQ